MDSNETTPEATVTITKSEYNTLLKANWKLQALEAGGVDNWEWYGESLEDYWKFLDENDL